MRHRLDVDRPDVVRHPDLGHLGDRHLQGEVRLGDPFPVKVQTGCCPGVKLGAECPCPALKQMGCFLGVECQELRLEPVLLEPPELHLNQALLELLELPVLQELLRPGLEHSEPLGLPGLEH